MQKLAKGNSVIKSKQREAPLFKGQKRIDLKNERKEKQYSSTPFVWTLYYHLGFFPPVVSSRVRKENF